jgi:hypothetical protein
VQPSTNGGKFAEYSNADRWGDAFIVSTVAELAFMVVEKVEKATDAGCQIGE